MNIAKDPALQAGLNPFGQRLEIADALHLIVWQLYGKVILDPRQQFQRLQTIDSQLAKKIVARHKRPRRHPKMVCRQVQNFFRGLLDCPRHEFIALVADIT
jgi:hypothetical protein